MRLSVGYNDLTQGMFRIKFITAHESNSRRVYSFFVLYFSRSRSLSLSQAPFQSNVRCGFICCLDDNFASIHHSNIIYVARSTYTFFFSLKVLNTRFILYFDSSCGEHFFRCSAVCELNLKKSTWFG